LNFNIKTGFQMAAFADYGAVWDDKSELRAKNFIAGYGIGFRFFMPIVGVLRVDIGWGQHGEGAFLHLGAFEKPIISRRRVR
jgi:outer membrane translocation and assembly module TamA